MYFLTAAMGVIIFFYNEHVTVTCCFKLFDFFSPLSVSLEDFSKATNLIWNRNLINEHSVIKNLLTLIELATTGLSKKNAMSAGMW